MSERTPVVKPHLNPDDNPFEPQGYYCHKCGEWYREEEMHRVDRVFDTVYYCSDCWDDDAEVECWCGLLHHISEPCDHDGQGVYGGPDVYYC